MKMTINLPEPKFKLNDKVEYYGQVTMHTIERMYFVANKTQSINTTDTLLGYWIYCLSDGTDKQSNDLKHYSGDFNKFVVKDTTTYKVMKEFDTLYSAVQYVMKNDKSDGWYDLEIYHKGYNDMHILTCLDAMLIMASYHKNSDRIDYLKHKFQYKLGVFGIRYNSDYEFAYEFAAYMLNIPLSQLEHITVS